MADVKNIDTTTGETNANNAYLKDSQDAYLLDNQGVYLMTNDTNK